MIQVEYNEDISGNSDTPQNMHVHLFNYYQYKLSKFDFSLSQGNRIINPAALAEIIDKYESLNRYDRFSSHSVLIAFSYMSIWRKA